MELELLEISTGVLKTPDGQSLEVNGGAYLSPEAYLATHGELSRLRQQQADAAASRALPMLMLGAGLFGLAVGLYLGRDSDED